MARRLRNVPQPPIDRLGRPNEFRALWRGLPVVGAGVALVVVGLLSSYDLSGGTGKKTPEYQLVELVTRGAVQRSEQPAAQGDVAAAVASTTTQAAPDEKPPDKPKAESGLVVKQNQDDYCPT